jgi:hypothetical protein
MALLLAVGERSFEAFLIFQKALFERLPAFSAFY